MPHLQTAEKKYCMSICTFLHERAKEDANTMFSIIYCDGNQGVWKWPGNKANVFPVVNSIIFMDKECARPCWLSSFTLMVLFIESLSLEDSVNTKFYKTALSHLCSQTMPWEVVHQLLNSAPWQYLGSQVCYHKQIFWWNNISLLPHPPYSSDLAPSNFFLFPHVKKTMKCQRFYAVKEIQTNMTRQKRAITGAYQRCFCDWHEHCVISVYNHLL